MIIASTLDSSKYDFKTKLPTRNNNIPTELKFRDENCAIYDFYTSRFSPPCNTLVRKYITVNPFIP